MYTMMWYSRIAWWHVIACIVIQCTKVATNITQTSRTICSAATCENICGHEGKSTFQGSCYCDSMCSIYGDCCRDYKDSCASHVPPRTGPTYADLLECTYLNHYTPRPFTEITIDKVKMVTKCNKKHHTVDADNVNKCESISMNISESIEQHVPVFSTSTMLLYRNRFCAMCNGLDETLTKPLAPRFQCAEKDNKQVFRKFVSENDISTFLINHCTLGFDIRELDELSAPFSHIRLLCSSVDSCPQNTKKGLSDLCSSYTEMIMLNGTFYQNVMCARCHGAAAEEIEVDHSCVTVLAGGGGEDTGVGLPMFQMLLDFSQKGRQLLRKITSYNGQPICTNSQMLNVEQNVCVEYDCTAAGTYLVNGKCTNRSRMPFVEAIDTESVIVLIVFKKSLVLTLDTMHKKHVELLFNIEIRNDFDEFEAMNIYFKDVNSSICVESPCYAFTVGAIQSEVSLERFIFSIDREKYRQDILHTLDMIDQVLVTVALQGNSVEIHCSDGNLHLTENATLLLDNFVQLAFLSNSVATMGEDWLSYKLNHTILQTITTLGKPIKRRTRILYCREEILTCPYSAVDGVFSILDIKGKHADNVTLYWEEMNKNITMPRGAFLIKGNYLLHCKKYGDMLNDLTIELDIHNIIQQYLGIGGVSLSIMCLFTALIGYCRMKQRFSLPFYVMINMCVSLMGAQLLFLTSQSVVGIKILCKAFAVAQHYFWLSAFLWMKIYSVSLTHLFISMVEVKHLSNNSVRVRCFVYAWGGPLIICLVCTILDVFTNHFIYGWDVFDVGSTCWIQPPLALVFSLALPLSLVMLINAVCLAIVIRIMVTPREVHDQANRRNSVLISVKLSAIMGFSWLFGLLANIDGLWFLSYGFVVLSSLQGVMILLIFGGNMYQQYRKGKMKQKFSLQRSALENL